MNDRRALGVAAIVAVIAVSSTAWADRLHLEGGGVVETPEWWIDGDTLVYRSAAGTVGVPRGMVVKIEESATAARPPERARPAQPPAADERKVDGRRRALEEFREGKTDFDARRFDSASARFREALRLDDTLHSARVGYAVCEMALGRDGLALSSVLDGLALDPRYADFHELLGDLRSREERMADAMRAWKHAFELAPSERLREKIIRGEQERSAAEDFSFAATSHFNLRYDGDVDRTLATSILEHLEEAYWDISDRFRHSPLQPINVLLYPTRAFRDVTRTPDTVAGLFDGKIRVPLGGLGSLNPRARQVLTHELSHAVVHSKTRANCPRWLQEGLAQRADGSSLSRADRAEIRTRLQRGPAERWEDAGFSYAVALSLVEYLEGRRGQAGINQVLDVLGEGKSIDEALRAVFRFDYAGLCRRWAREQGGAER